MQNDAHLKSAVLLVLGVKDKKNKEIKQKNKQASTVIRVHLYTYQLSDSLVNHPIPYILFT